MADFLTSSIADVMMAPVARVQEGFQDALSLHRDAGDWNTLQQHLHAFASAVREPRSTEVLEYVGLLGDSLLAQACRGR